MRKEKVVYRVKLEGVQEFKKQCKVVIKEMNKLKDELGIVWYEEEPKKEKVKQ